LYKDEVLPSHAKRIVIEQSTGYTYYPFLREKDELIALSKFASSGNKEDIQKKFSFDMDSLEKQIRIS